MNQLPFRARLYVMAVLAAGALLFFTRLFRFGSMSRCSSSS